MSFPWMELARPDWLLDAAVKATLILAAAFALAGLARRAPARARHALWGTALIGALLVPVLSMALPGWSVPLLPRVDGSGDPARIAATGPSEVPPSADPAAPATAASAASLPTGKVVRPEPTPPAGPGEHRSIGEMILAPARALPWGTLLISLWLGGALAEALRLGHGLATLRGWTRRASRVADAETRSLVQGLRRMLGLRRDVRVLRSEELRTPLTWGWLRPVVLLPAAADRWGGERRRVVLLHELSHVRRLDWPIQMAAQLARAVYWFHPLAWLAERCLRLEREQACDESVLAHGTRASEYAAHLLEIARAGTARNLAPMAGLSMVHPGQLERRLLAMLNRRRPSRRRTFLSISALALLMGALVVTVSAVEPWEEPPEAPEAPSSPGPAKAPSAAPAPPADAQPAQVPGVAPELAGPTPAADAEPGPEPVLAPAPVADPLPVEVPGPTAAPVAPTAPSLAGPDEAPSARPAPEVKGSGYLL